MATQDFSSTDQVAEGTTLPPSEGTTLPSRSEEFVSTDQVFEGTTQPLDAAGRAESSVSRSEEIAQQQYVDVGVGSEERVAQATAEAEAIRTDMSESFLGARGTFYRVPLRTGSGSGLYAVESLSRFVASAKKERAEAQRRLKFDSRHESHVEEIPELLDTDMGDDYFASVDLNQEIDS